MPEIGLHNFKNRFYHADLGRFLQNDPIRFDGGDLNLYRYCFNDSINHVDPDGLSKLERRRWADDVGGPALEPPEYQPAARSREAEISKAGAVAVGMTGTATAEGLILGGSGTAAAGQMLRTGGVGALLGWVLLMPGDSRLQSVTVPSGEVRFPEGVKPGQDVPEGWQERIGRKGSTVHEGPDLLPGGTVPPRMRPDTQTHPSDPHTDWWPGDGTAWRVRPDGTATSKKDKVKSAVRKKILEEQGNP